MEKLTGDVQCFKRKEAWGTCSWASLQNNWKWKKITTSPPWINIHELVNQPSETCNNSSMNISICGFRLSSDTAWMRIGCFESYNRNVSIGIQEKEVTYAKGGCRWCNTWGQGAVLGKGDLGLPAWGVPAVPATSLACLSPEAWPPRPWLTPQSLLLHTNFKSHNWTLDNRFNPHSKNPSITPIWESDWKFQIATHLFQQLTAS